MMKVLAVLSLLSLSYADLPVPGTTGLVPGSAAEAQWYQQQLAHIAMLNGRNKRSLPVPGTIPGLIPGSAAEAQW